MKNSSDKKDRLERFVRDNRDGFDTFLPKDDLWDRISDALPQVDTPTKPILNGKRPTIGTGGRSFFDWRIAATVFLAVSLGFLFYLNKEYGVTRDPRVAFNSPSYAKEFNQYCNSIEEKRGEIIKLTRNNPELYKNFSADFEGLEVNYQSLRAKLPNTPNREALLRAMVQNLQWQIELLNQQLKVIERIKDENGDKETNADSSPVI